MLDNHTKAAIEKFVKAIKDTEVYKGYRYQLEKIKKNPELFEQVNEYRHRNFEVQNTSQVNELLDKMDAFEKEYEKLLENPMVEDFLQAELAFCRLMQEVDTMITEQLDFE